MQCTYFVLYLYLIYISIPSYLIALGMGSLLVSKIYGTPDSEYVGNPISIKLIQLKQLSVSPSLCLSIHPVIHQINNVIILNRITAGGMNQHRNLISSIHRASTVSTTALSEEELSLKWNTISHKTCM